MPSGNAAIAIDNYALTGSIGASSSAVGMPASNMLTSHPSTRWRSLTSAAWFVLDMGVVRSIDTIMLAGLTCGSTSEMRVRLSATDATAATVVDHDSGTLLSGNTAFDSDYGYLAYRMATPLSARYLRIDGSDPAASYFEAGCLLAALSEEFEFNFVGGATVSWIDRSAVDTVESGQTLTWQRDKFRRVSLSFDAIRKSQRDGVWERMSKVNGSTKNALLILDTASATMARNSIFGRITTPPELAYLQAVEMFGSQLRMDERL